MLDYKRTRIACTFTNLSMSISSNLSPLFFLTFRTMYGLSYSLLGLLVVINFFTQLLVDLLFSFFSHRFNIHKTVRITPVIISAGLLLYATAPFLFSQNVYLGLSLGTILFSLGCGLAEVLLSPVIAAMPADDPQREMSKFHSIYAWGVVGVILLSTLFLACFGNSLWWLLSLLYVSIPLTAALLFAGAKFPPLETPKALSSTLRLLKNKGLLLFVFAIFLGGAAECTMAQWSSGFLEQVFGIDKVWGDAFGVAMFSLTLGLGRTLYARFGKNLPTLLILEAVCATLCYLAVALSPSPLLGLLACAFTGFAVSMMWPGLLSLAAEQFPIGGVFVYALMAAGGDLGASAAPQLVGIVTDVLSQSDAVLRLANRTGFSPEQIGFRGGMLLGAAVSFFAIFVFSIIARSFYKKQPAHTK